MEFRCLLIVTAEQPLCLGRSERAIKEEQKLPHSAAANGRNKLQAGPHPASHCCAAVDCPSGRARISHRSLTSASAGAEFHPGQDRSFASLTVIAAASTSGGAGPLHTGWFESGRSSGSSATTPSICQGDGIGLALGSKPEVSLRILALECVAPKGAIMKSKRLNPLAAAGPFAGFPAPAC